MATKCRFDHDQSRNAVVHAGCAVDGNDTKEERSLILRDRSDRARSGDPIA